MPKYNVGDKVRVISNPSIYKRYLMDDRSAGNTMPEKMHEFAGKVVTISKIQHCQYRIKEDGETWLWTDEMFDSKVNQKIVITTDGRITTARLYDGKKILKSAESKCNPKDTFDFEVGAKLAFERLTGRSSEIKVGDKVEVVNAGDLYKLYTDWFKLNDCEELLPYYQYNSSICENKTYTVVAIGHHRLTPHIMDMCAIKNNRDRIYLIHIKGIKKCQ